MGWFECCLVVKGYRMWLVGVARRGQSRDGVRAMHLLGTCGLSVDFFLSSLSMVRSSLDL